MNSRTGSPASVCRCAQALYADPCLRKKVIVLVRPVARTTIAPIPIITTATVKPTSKQLFHLVAHTETGALIHRRFDQVGSARGMLNFKLEVRQVLTWPTYEFGRISVLSGLE